MRPDTTHRAEAKRLREAIARVAFVLPGTLAQRRAHCGYAACHYHCHCYAEPPKLHGPYWFWTRKVQAKTITRLLTDDPVTDYQACFDNTKTLRNLVSELEALRLDIVVSDPRSARRPGGRKPAARGDRVVGACLTRGWATKRRPNTQVRPLREDLNKFRSPVFSNA